MLTIYRRHRAGCKHRSRHYKKCFCPIWVQGVLDGVSIRRSLDLTGWEAANRKIHELETHGEKNAISVKDACEKFKADCKARNLSAATVKKYKYVLAELEEKFGSLPVRSVTVDDLRTLRQGWTFAASTARKRVEYLRAFFAFCVSSGWIQNNPAKGLKAPLTKQMPTLPYSEEEWKKILWAVDSICEIHRQISGKTQRTLRALILLMRFSGLRISDAVSLKRDRINYKTAKLFVYQAKTGQPVWVPLPKTVLDALKECDEGNEGYFWSGPGTLQTAQTKWQARLKKVFTIAGIPDAHSHRFRDTFAVDLLAKGVSLETVSILLGHQSIAVTQKHYAPWVQSRQDALEKAVKGTWA